MVRDICGARWSLDDKLLLYGIMTFFHPRNKKGDSATDIVRVAGLVATRKRGTTSLLQYSRIKLLAYLGHFS